MMRTPYIPYASDPRGAAAGKGFVAAGWLAEDDRAVFLVQYDDGIGPEDHRVGRFGPGGAGYGLGPWLARPA